MLTLLSNIMKKLVIYLMLFVPFMALQANPPPPGLPDDPVPATIDSMIFILFTVGIAFGGYIILKKTR